MSEKKQEFKLVPAKIVHSSTILPPREHSKEVIESVKRDIHQRNG